jgi:hypothetical protein
MWGGAAAPYLAKLVSENIGKSKIIEALKNTVIINKEDFDALAQTSKMIKM